MVYCDKEYVAKVIKQARKKLNLKQSELAEKIGISEKHLSKIETGKNYLALDNFLKIVEVLGISLKDFGINNSSAEEENKQKLFKLINVSSDKQINMYLDVIETIRKHV